MVEVWPRPMTSDGVTSVLIHPRTDPVNIRLIQTSFPKCSWRNQIVNAMRVLLTSAIILAQFRFVASATELNTLIPLCPEWLAAADSFLAECQTHARYFTRTFYPSGGSRGEKEENSAWFAAAPPDSHFLMGCTLRYDHTLSFLGLYYTAEPSAIIQANHAPILGIDFDGDVVLKIDDHPVTFVAAQPFDTSQVKTRWSTSSTVPRNCDDPVEKDGRYHFMRGSLFVDLSSFHDKKTVSIGASRSTTQMFRYIEFFPSSATGQVIYAWGAPVLVMSSGTILVRDDWFPRVCNEGVPDRVANSPLLLHQLCRLSAAR
jgi:hypothetical protein